MVICIGSCGGKKAKTISVRDDEKNLFTEQLLTCKQHQSSHFHCLDPLSDGVLQDIPRHLLDLLNAELLHPKSIQIVLQHNLPTIHIHLTTLKLVICDNHSLGYVLR